MNAGKTNSEAFHAMKRRRVTPALLMLREITRR